MAPDEKIHKSAIDSLKGEGGNLPGLKRQKKATDRF